MSGLHMNLKSAGLYLVCWKLLMVDLVSSEKILLLPYDHPGHLNFFCNTGEALLKHGHEIHMLSMEKHRSKITASGIKPLLHTQKEKSLQDDPDLDEAVERMLLNKHSALDRINMASMLMKKSVSQYEEILASQDLRKIVDQEKYDLAIVDGSIFSYCSYALVYRHNIRYITMTNVYAEPWQARVPSMFSVEPMPLFPYSNEMTFFQRVKSFMAGTTLAFAKPLIGATPSDFVEKYVPEKPKVTLEELYTRSEMFFNNIDILLMDYPRTSAPHFLYVGAVGGTPAKQLEKELKEFVSSAEKGIIVVSFGSIVKVFPTIILQKLFKIFSLLPELKFVFRVPNNFDLEIPSNVKIMKWLPQNDLLGHKNTKAFFTHGGGNGFLEAVYHAVPMIVSPVAGDQIYHASKIEHKQYGKIVHIASDSAEDIVEIIKEVSENPIYAMKLKKAKDIMNSLPKANETVAYWVNHILKFGSDHIHPSYMDIPLYKFFMLDILLFIIIFVFLTMWICCRCCKCCCRNILCRHKKKKQD